MKLCSGSGDFPVFPNGCAITIGTFDGMHRGHQALFTRLSEKAHAMGLPVVAILFEPQPAEYLVPEDAPPRLTSLREKLVILQDLGVAAVCCLRFDARLASMTCEEFAARYLFSGLHARYLLVGSDFRFGKGRGGGVRELAAITERHQVPTEVFADFVQAGTRISSTRVRHALQVGDFTEAANLLGRPYSICGRVVRGHQRGSQWGFPTANIRVSRKSAPLSGVFCVAIKGAKDAILQGVANLGTRPTVDGSRLILEVHIPGFEGELYGKRLDVVFLHKLRDERRFTDTTELVAHIAQDVRNSIQWFEDNPQRSNTGRL